ncbi:MAG: hypothetical protein WA104_05775 [Thermodesulfovibrionales bacterium]
MKKNSTAEAIWGFSKSVIGILPLVLILLYFKWIYLIIYIILGGLTFFIIKSKRKVRAVNALIAHLLFWPVFLLLWKELIKEPPSVLDAFNDLADKGSQNTNTPLMCYKMAYMLLPQELHQNPQATLERFRRPQSTNAGALFYTKACISSGCMPRRKDAAEFYTHIGRLSPKKTYYIIQYPTPSPVCLDAGLPVLAPYFSAAIIEETTGRISYYVLGQAFTGGTTLRTVTADGTNTITNTNIGEGSEPTLEAFLQLLQSMT